MLKKIIFVVCLAITGNVCAKQPFSGKLKKKNIEEVCNAVAGWQAEGTTSFQFRTIVIFACPDGLIASVMRSGNM